jgi:hypothetical protein
MLILGLLIYLTFNGTIILILFFNGADLFAAEELVSSFGVLDST